MLACRGSILYSRARKTLTLEGNKVLRSHAAKERAQDHAASRGAGSARISRQSKRQKFAMCAAQNGLVAIVSTLRVHHPRPRPRTLAIGAEQPWRPPNPCGW